MALVAPEEVPQSGMGGTATAATNLTGGGAVNAVALAVGGAGGDGWKIGGNPGSGALGGNATATASGTASGDNSVSASASAFGGSGGANGGSGGAATANATGSSGSGTVQVSASVTGGAGGNSDSAFADPDGNALGISGVAGAAANLTNAVSGSTTGALSLSQSATGGAGGSGFNLNAGAAGGNATSILTVHNNTAGSLSGTVNAAGGAGGSLLCDCPSAPIGGGVGGNAAANIALASAVSGVNVSSTANATGGAGGIGTLGDGHPQVQGTAGTANATASASAVGSGIALANSTAVGSGGAAVATSTSSGPSGQSIVASATSPLGGATANAVTQTSFGGAVSSPSALNAGQSFSVTNAVVAGPVTTAVGSMGAAYGGTGQSLTYQESANFITNNSVFVVGLLNSASLGNGFDSAVFDIDVNGNVFDTKSFNSLASAQTFFSNDLIDVSLSSGANDVELLLDETMSSAEGFSFGYAAVSAAPLPASWIMMLTGLAGTRLRCVSSAEAEPCCCSRLMQSVRMTGAAAWRCSPRCASNVM